MSETTNLSNEEVEKVSGGKSVVCKCCICGSDNGDYKAQFDAFMCWDCYQKELKK